MTKKIPIHKLETKFIELCKLVANKNQILNQFVQGPRSVG